MVTQINGIAPSELGQIRADKAAMWELINSTAARTVSASAEGGF